MQQQHLQIKPCGSACISLLLKHDSNTGPDCTHFEAHDKALHLLHMRLEVGRLYGQLAVAAEAQHILKLAVPCHTVAALLFVQ